MTHAHGQRYYSTRRCMSIRLASVLISTPPTSRIFPMARENTCWLCGTRDVRQSEAGEERSSIREAGSTPSHNSIRSLCVVAIRGPRLALCGHRDPDLLRVSPIAFTTDLDGDETRDHRRHIHNPSHCLEQAHGPCHGGGRCDIAVADRPQRDKAVIKDIARAV